MDSRRASPDVADVPALWMGWTFALLVFGALVVYWAVLIRPAYFPQGDEFSLLAHSTHVFHASPREWFRHGFAGYFEPYPDLSVPYSNFLRPVANLTYFVQSLVFGRSWAFYLLGNYLIITALLGTVWYLARKALTLPAPLAIGVLAATAVCPAVSYQAILRPSFAFDLLGALWALLALYALLRHRFTFAVLFVTFAVFTKETAYYTALSAAAVILLFAPGSLARRALRSALALAPLLAVGLLRHVDFPGPRAGVYVLSQAGEGSALKRLILALTHWPYTLPGEQHIFELSLRNLAALLLTAVSWGLLLLFLRLALRSRESIRPSPGKVASLAESRLALLIFLIGALLLPLGLDLAPRFGASVYPLFFLALASLVGLTRSRPVQGLAVAVLLLTGITDAASLASSLFGSALHREQRLWARSRNLVDLLAHRTEPVAFLVADASESFSSPDSVQQLSGYAGKLIPISNLDVGDCPGGNLTVQPATTSGYLIHVLSPGSCGGSSLAATFHPTPKRLSVFTRQLDEAQVSYNAYQGGWSNGEFGTKQMDVLLVPKTAAYVLLVPVAENSSAFHTYLADPR